MMGCWETCSSVKKLEKAVGRLREGTHHRGKSAAMLFVRAGDCEGGRAGSSQSQAFHFPFARVNRPGPVSMLQASLLLSGVAWERLEVEATGFVRSVGGGSL